MKATRKALVAIAVLGALITLVVHGSRTSTASASTSASATLPIASAPAQPSASLAVVAEGHESELSLALHDLETGATCDDRMHAIERLLALGDSNAVSALRTARLRKDNACLRAAAAQAITALDGRI